MAKRAIAIAALLLTTAPAQAAIESELVREGMAAFEDLEFERAIEILDRALGESLTREEKIATYKTLAFAHGALGHTDETRASFVRLLRVDENFDLEKSVAPKVRALFEEARAAVATGKGVPGAVQPEERAPHLKPEMSPHRPREGQPIMVYVDYPGGVAHKVQLFHRSRGQARFSMVTANSDAEGHFELRLPGSEVRAPGLDYYLTAVDESGAAVARAGTLAQPLTVEVTVPPRPVYKKGWFWGLIVGLAVAGGAVGAAVALTVGRTDPNAPASLTIIAPK
jgi:tetratricopeptide (TPR) repeat protein